MGLGGAVIAALSTVICLKVPFSDGLGGKGVESLKTRRPTCWMTCGFFIAVRGWRQSKK